jgi:hypothetical protein
MLKIVVAGIACGLCLVATAKAADQSDKAAIQQATQNCRAEVKEHAKYYEMPLYARHKAVNFSLRSRRVRMGFWEPLNRL